MTDIDGCIARADWDALFVLGEDALPGIEAALGRADAPARVDLLSVVHRFDCAAATAILERALADGHNRVKAFAIDALAERGSGAAIAPLLAALAEDQGHLYQVAAERVQKLLREAFGDEAFVRELMRYLQSGPRSRPSALRTFVLAMPACASVREWMEAMRAARGELEALIPVPKPVIPAPPPPRELVRGVPLPRGANICGACAGTGRIVAHRSRMSAVQGVRGYPCDACGGKGYVV